MVLPLSLSLPLLFSLFILLLPPPFTLSRFCQSSSSHLLVLKVERVSMIRRSPLDLFLHFLLFVVAQSNESTPATTAYEVLRRHGLPSGLLPKGVRSFRLDEDGLFEVHLEEECTAKFETEVHYERNITGKLSYGQIASISGILAKELFLWFPVRVIRVDIPSSGLIYFDVGVIYKQFSLSLFETPPDCSPAAPSSSPDHLLEGYRIAEIISKSKSGQLRYFLDQDNPEIAVI